MSEICKLFQTIKLQMIFILTTINNKSTTRDVFRYNVSLFMIAPDQTSIKPLNYFQIYCISQLFILKCETSKYPTNLPRAFHVETTWKRPTDIRKKCSQWPRLYFLCTFRICHNNFMSNLVFLAVENVVSFT